MPYIPQEERKQFVPSLYTLKQTIRTKGQLNYVITMACLQFLGDAPRYDNYQDMVGTLECVKLEFYTRRVAAYEREKEKLNGDLVNRNTDS